MIPSAQYGDVADTKSLLLRGCDCWICSEIRIMTLPHPSQSRRAGVPPLGLKRQVQRRRARSAKHPDWLHSLRHLPLSGPREALSARMMVQGLMRMQILVFVLSLWVRPTFAIH